MNGPKITKFTVVSMMTAGKPGWQIVAHYSDGQRLCWGVQTTERGVKSCMTRFAKRIGFKVHKSEILTEIYAE